MLKIDKKDRATKFKRPAVRNILTFYIVKVS
jgi:hypothetical protein